MKSPTVRQGSASSQTQLEIRKYSPMFRAFVIVAIFIVAVFILAACGSTPKQSASSTPTTNSAIPSATTPSSSAAITTQAALTCDADKSSDVINAGKYFGNILAQVKTQWKPDTVISSVRFANQYVKNFQGLCTLKTDSNWQIVFYSLSSKTEISGYLDNSKKDSAGIPPVIFTVDKTDNSASTSLTYADMKKQGGWKFHKFSRPETFASESKYAANMFLNWKMSMSGVVQRIIDRVRVEKITGAGFNVYVGKASLKTKTPYVSIYWENGAKKTNFYVEPISLKTYNVKY